MLSILDTVIPAHRVYKSHPNYWFVTLYHPITRIRISTQGQLNAVQAALSEAVQAGVIQSDEALLGDILLVHNLESRFETAESRCQALCARVLRAEGKAERIAKSYERYRALQRTSMLVGMALQVIPVAGGVVSGVIAAGAEVVHGVTVKDVADYAFSFSEGVAEVKCSGISDRVFTAAGAAEGGDVIGKEVLQEVERVKREGKMGIGGVRNGQFGAGDRADVVDFDVVSKVAAWSCAEVADAWARYIVKECEEEQDGHFESIRDVVLLVLQKERVRGRILVCHVGVVRAIADRVVEKVIQAVMAVEKVDMTLGMEACVALFVEDVRTGMLDLQHF